MRDSYISNDLLRRVTPLAAQRYAVRHGWTRVPIPPQFRIAIYRQTNEPDRELVIPQNFEVGDYVARMDDFVQVIAASEGKSPTQILNSLLFPSADIVRFGLVSPDTRWGTIALPDGMDLYDSAIRSIASTTYDVIRPQPFHARMSNPDADAYIRSCRMGQTEISSFVVSCICPVEPEAQSNLLTADLEEVDVPAFGRQVTNRLVSALTQINEFVLADATDRLVNPEPGDIRISGNFFESLLGFPLSTDETSLYVNVTWDTTLPAASAQSRVDLRYDFYPSLQNVARQLRPSRVASDGRFVAKVNALRGGLNTENRMEGDVVLHLLDDDLSLKAKVWLNADDYAKACDAHKLNQPVTISGSFVRGRKVSNFQRYSDFAVLALEVPVATLPLTQTDEQSS